MKKITCAFFFLWITAFCYSQQVPSVPETWGTWGLGYIKNNNSLNIYTGYNIQGFHMYVSWDMLEPTKGNFKWDELDKQFQLLADAKLWIGVQILVGPNCPSWIYNNVPRVMTTGGQDDGPYPYYLDRDYKDRYFFLLRKMGEHIENLPADIKKRFMYWQISEGSTGDGEPYKGDVVEQQYAIDWYTWDAYKKAAWDSANVYRADNWYRLQFNTGNFGENLQYANARFPRDQQKNGTLSHWYGFDGEILYYTRQYKDFLRLPFSLRTRGEVQDNFNRDWWMEAPVKNAFALVCSALSGGLDMMNIAGGYINSTLDTRPTAFFNKYAGLRFAAQSNRGFIALRDVPDFSDTIRFPQEEYGRVIPASQENAFLNRIEKIENNPKDSSMYKYWQKMKAIVQYLNPARVQKITEEFAPAGAMYNESGDDLHNDFGVNMVNNYFMFITQLKPDETSIGGWRVGPDTSMYGRYCRLFKIERNVGEMLFQFNERLVEPGENVKATIVYFDVAGGKWSINGSNKRVVVTNTGTNQWVKKEVGLNNFVPNTEREGADFSLQYEDGANTPFALIEVEVN